MTGQLHILLVILFSVSGLHAKEFHCVEENKSFFIQIKNSGDYLTDQGFQELVECKKSISQEIRGGVCAPTVFGFKIFSAFTLLSLGDDFRIFEDCYFAVNNSRGYRVCAPSFGQYRQFDLVTGADFPGFYGQMGSCIRNL